ncbi:MAG: rRNA maturation RNase YbeY [Acidobacteria bacterium]|nr:rRNA maturation RNase YbeY [Acidobacteriota bacterium]
MILNRQTRVRVALTPLERFARRLRRELRLNGREVSICLVSDAEMARLNKKYRRKNKATDVLSFPAGTNSRKNSVTPMNAVLKPGATFLGDIAIAPAVARRNAKKFGRTLPDELRILILHGVLHLMGYDHETDRGQMERRERALRRRLDLV